MRTDPIPLAGGAYTDESRPFSMQDTVNLRAQRAEAGGTRAPDKLQTLPGLRPFAAVGSGAIRGTHNAEGRLVAVADRILYGINADAETVAIGTVPGTGRVMIDHNQISLGNEVMLVNGSAGYLWNTVTNAFGRITDPGFPGGSVVRFLSGYFVVIEPQGRFAQSSGAAQGLSWNTLDRFTSEVSPDRLMAAGVRGSELLLLSASSGEFFQATANAQQPFRTKRIDFKVGATGPYVVAEGDNNIWWLGSDGVFYCLNGYSQARISTRPIEDAIKGLDWSRAFAYRWDTVIYWTFPDGTTFGYDYAEREWHRRESYGLERWRVNSMTYWNKRWIAGDFQAGRLWDCNIADRYYLEGGTPYVCRRTIGVSHDNQNPVRAPRLELVMDTGHAATVPVAFPGVWQPISPDNLDYTFVAPGGALLEDGIVSLDGAGLDASWSLELPVGVHQLRVTAIEFGGSAGSTAALFTWDGGSQANASGSDASFTPSPFELTAEGAALEFGFSEEPPATIAYQFLVEVLVESPAPDIVTTDHEVRMQFADDGQPNFSNWDPRSIGDVGKYGLRLVWTRLGQYTQRVYTFESSSPRCRDMLGAVATIERTR